MNVISSSPDSCRKRALKIGSRNGSAKMRKRASPIPRKRRSRFGFLTTICCFPSRNFTNAPSMFSRERARRPGFTATGWATSFGGECLDFLDILQCAVQKASAFDGSAAYRLYCRVRIKLRLLMDFRQLSEKQWFFINERLEKIQKSLRLESFGLRSTGVSPIESGDPLPAIGNEVLPN